MTFPNPPAPRIAYDVDGTAVFLKTTSLMNQGSPYPASTLFQVPDVVVQQMNTSASGFGAYIDPTVWYTPPSSGYLLFLFPTKIDLAGIFWLGGWAFFSGVKYMSDFTLETSRDTTNGEDGTWTIADAAPMGIPSTDISSITGSPLNVLTGTPVLTNVPLLPASPAYRKDQADNLGYGFRRVSGAAYSGIKGLRLRLPDTSTIIRNGTPLNAVYVVHLYGLPSYNASVNRVAPWEAALDLPLAQSTMSWGDVPLASTEDRSFRLKNMSPLQAAQNINIYMEDESGYPSGVANEFLFSFDGVTWTGQVTLVTLSSSAVSQVIYVRRVTPATAPLSSWSPRIRFDVGSWV